jgi:hypothetical protein
MDRSELDKLIDETIRDEFTAETALTLPLKDLCGFHEDAAKRLCELNGLDVRITRRNGRQSAKLTDSRMDRVILHVDYCIVVDARIG